MFAFMTFLLILYLKSKRIYYIIGYYLCKIFVKC